jgi:hypothetical protein
MAQAVSRPSLIAKAVNVGFVVNKSDTGIRIFSDYVGFSLSASFHQWLPTHLLICHRRYSYLSSQVTMAHESCEVNSTYKPNYVYIVHTR